MDLVADFGVYGSCCILAYLSAIFPFINAEVVLLGYVVAAGGDWRRALVFAALVSTGQMIGKGTMYWAFRGTSHLRSERARESLRRWEARLTRSPRSVLLFVLLSASTGFPPFYILSIAAGSLRVNFAGFMIAGLIGRLVRFGLIALFPAGLRQLW